MGGFGSTRWGWHRTREVIDPLLWLDVRILARRGALTPGVWSTTSWTCRGEPSGYIDHQAEAGALILDYRTKGPGDADWQPVRDRIPLDHTPCHYGGSRPWFLCPGCGGRRAVLYSVGGRFRCVKCHDLAYSSTREEPWDRAIRRADTLRRKIGGRPGAEREWVLNWLVPPDRPKGMPWRTYDRLRQEWRAIATAANGDYEAGLLRLLERTDRVLKGLRG